MDSDQPSDRHDELLVGFGVDLLEGAVLHEALLQDNESFVVDAVWDVP